MQFLGDRFWRQPTPIAVSSAVTLTVAQLLTGIIVFSGTVARTLTLPTGTLTDAGITSPPLPVDECFDWFLINTGTSSGAATVAAGTGHTIVGSATVAIGTSSQWRTRKTAANTFVTYRIG